MLIEETVTYLEMTSPDQLVPGLPPSAPVEMEALDRGSAPLLRSTYARIAAPYGWISRSAWSDEQWAEWLSSPTVQAWLARVGDEVVGMVELQSQSVGDVEIVILGLAPEFVGKYRRTPPDGGDPVGLGGEVAGRYLHDPSVAAHFLAGPSSCEAELRTSWVSSVPDRAQAARGSRLEVPGDAFSYESP